MYYKLVSCGATYHMVESDCTCQWKDREMDMDNSCVYMYVQESATKGITIANHSST